MFGNQLGPVIEVIKKKDKASAIAASLEKLSKHSVYVGVPEDKTGRKQGEMTNALLAYIHTEGSPVNNIPPRPFLQPSILANKDAIAALQGKALKDALNGQDVMSDLQRIGMFARDCAKRWFDDPRNNWPPNKPATIARKGSDAPLIDTGQLKNSISYVVD